jgi:hypothetical protein
MRRVLFAFAALAAVLIYLIWWVTYAGIHYIPRRSATPTSWLASRCRITPRQRVRPLLDPFDCQLLAKGKFSESHPSGGTTKGPEREIG